MKRRATVFAVVIGLLVAGCSGRTAAPKTVGGAVAVPARPGAAAPARFARAIIAAQDPQDRLDVDLARCIDAIMPGAKTLPGTKKVHLCR